MFWDELSQHLFGKMVVDFVEEMAESAGDHGPPKEIMDFVGKSYLFKLIGFSENDGGVRTYHINTVEDDTEIVALNRPNHRSSDPDDSDDDLMLLSRTTTKVTSKEMVAIEDDEVLNPSSKRPLDKDDVDEDGAPTNQCSTNKKMKDVKLEKD